MSQAADEAQPPLARLFAIAYRQLITDLHAELARRGWTDVRPAYGFALLALREGPLSSGELGVLMGMTKQASSKLVEALVDAGYARRGASIGDARVRPIELTDRGRDLQKTAERIYTDLESRWADVIGQDRLAALRADLISVTSDEDGCAAAGPPTVVTRVGARIQRVRSARAERCAVRLKGLRVSTSSVDGEPTATVVRRRSPSISAAARANPAAPQPCRRSRSA